MRQFNFNGYFTAGSDNQVAIIVEDVMITQEFGDKPPVMACHYETFQEALEKIGWKYDEVDFYLYEILNPSTRITVDFNNLYQDEDTVYFRGRPLQQTCFKDKLYRPIYEGHKLDGAEVVFCDETGQWGLKYPKRDRPIPLYNRIDNFIQGYSLPLTPLCHEEAR